MIWVLNRQEVPRMVSKSSVTEGPILRSRLLGFQETNYRSHTNNLLSMSQGDFSYRLVDQLSLKGNSWGHPVQGSDLKSQSWSYIRLTPHSLHSWIPTFCRYLFLMPQIWAERGRDKLRAPTCAADDTRGAHFACTSTWGPLNTGRLQQSSVFTLRTSRFYVQTNYAMCFDVNNGGYF